MAYDKTIPARAILFKLSRPDGGCIYQQWYSNTGIFPKFGLDERGNFWLSGVDWPIIFDQLVLEVQNATWQLDVRHDFAGYEARCDGSV